MPTTANQPAPGAIHDPTHLDPKCEPNHFGGGNAVEDWLDQLSWPNTGPSHGAINPASEPPWIDPGGYLINTYGVPPLAAGSGG